MKILQDHSLNGGPGRIPEVHQKSDLKTSSTQIVQNLRPMFGRDVADSFQFHDYRVEAYEVWAIGLLQGVSLVGQIKGWLRPKRDVAGGELQRKALLVNRLQEPSPDHAVHFKYRALNSKNFLRAD